MPRWKARFREELSAAIRDSPDELRLAVHAHRAGTARRRLNAMADRLEEEGYIPDTVDPTKDPTADAWSAAIFVRRRGIH